MDWGHTRVSTHQLLFKMAPLGASHYISIKNFELLASEGAFNFQEMTLSIRWWWLKSRV